MNDNVTDLFGKFGVLDLPPDILVLHLLHFVVERPELVDEFEQFLEGRGIKC
jgi:hypothetical protein